MKFIFVFWFEMIVSTETTIVYIIFFFVFRFAQLAQQQKEKTTASPVTTVPISSETSEQSKYKWIKH